MREDSGKESDRKTDACIKALLALEIALLNGRPFLEKLGRVAQSVEQWTENPRVDSSILSLDTTFPGGTCDRDRLLRLIRVPGRQGFATYLLQSSTRSRKALLRLSAVCRP